MLKQSPTFFAHIYMAGDLADARRVCRRYTFDVGLCVTIEAVDYVYTGGAETGFRVGIINYPRFPKEPSEVRQVAEALAELLRAELAQHSFSIVMPDVTIWNTTRED